MLSASINIDQDIEVVARDDPDPFGSRVVVLEIGKSARLSIHFSSWQGNEATCRALDRLIGPLTELRAAADARLVEEIAASFEATA